MKIGLRIAMLLILLVTSAAGGEPALVIDLRGVKQELPELNIVRGQGNGGAVGSNVPSRSPLRLSFSVFHGVTPVVGREFEYQLEFLNDSDKAIWFPKSPSWSDVRREGLVQSFQKVVVFFTLTDPAGGAAFVASNVALYGARDKPGTMFPLAPGQSVVIKASTVLQPQWGATAPSSAASAVLSCELNLRTVSIIPTRDGSAFQQHESTSVRIVSEKNLQVRLR